jgi:hypothetical protein
MSEYSKMEQPSENPIHHPVIMEGRYADGESGTEEERRELVAFYKLPEDAGWDQIWQAVWEVHRKDLASRFGLPETASWDDVHLMLADKRLLDGTFDRILNIPADATPEQRLKLGKILRPEHGQE